MNDHFDQFDPFAGFGPPPAAPKPPPSPPPVEPPAFGGRPMPAGLAQWCAGELRRLGRGGDLTLAEFCFSLDSADEIRGYFEEYLGRTPEVVQFSSVFVSRLRTLREISPRTPPPSRTQPVSPPAALHSSNPFDQFDPFAGFGPPPAAPKPPPVEPPAFGGRPMPAGFAQWCAGELRRLGRGGDLTLAEFCFSLDSADEIRGYFEEYLGRAPEVRALAAAFVMRRESQTDPLNVFTGAGCAAPPAQEWDPFPAAAPQRELPPPPSEPQPQPQPVLDPFAGLLDPFAGLPWIPPAVPRPCSAPTTHHTAEAPPRVMSVPAHLNSSGYVEDMQPAPPSAASGECVVCMARDRDATFVHAESGVGHTACCMSCATTLQQCGQCCPICRQPFSFVIRNYSS